MLFNSFHFLVFFPVVLILFYLLPHRFRWILLLAASYYFYIGWNAIYLSLLVITTTVDFFVARKIEDTNVRSIRIRWLYVSIFVNLSLLFYFKYYNFFIDNINFLSGSELKYMEFLLPVGISFYTFQEMGYVIDVYRGQLAAERHIGRFALFVSYFPQLVAGPIERASHLIHQLKAKVILHYSNFSEGAKFIVWGFFKKVVIADNIAPIVDLVYNNPDSYSGGWLLMASYLFAIQIYCDFSGYSDIAIGVARTMGVKLMENFKLPYFASGIKEFWSRWHISLSTWFRDYLYVPLGGNRISDKRTAFNLFVVFAVSGLWHGANWTFVIWGVLHGTYLLVERQLSKLKLFVFEGRWWKWLRIALVFHLVVLGWIFFRAENLNDVSVIFRRILNWSPQLNAPGGEIARIGTTGLMFRLILVALFMIADSWLFRVTKNEVKLMRIWKLILFGFIAACILLFGNWGEVSFIYFQF